MSEQNTNSQPATSQKSELEALKERATKMGSAYPENIGVEALRSKVNAAIEAAQNQENKSAENQAPAAAVPEPSIYDQQRDEYMRMVRVRISCLNPNKANVPGEVITFVNGVLGKVSKFVPFSDAAAESYHLPKILYDVLVARRYVQIKSIKMPNGRRRIERRLVPEFSLEVLPPLTEDEIQDLAARQHAAGSTND